MTLSLVVCVIWIYGIVGANSARPLGTSNLSYHLDIGMHWQGNTVVPTVYIPKNYIIVETI